jgi:hypothetical protein
MKHGVVTGIDLTALVGVAEQVRLLRTTSLPCVELIRVVPGVSLESVNFTLTPPASVVRVGGIDGTLSSNAL